MNKDLARLFAQDQREHAVPKLAGSPAYAEMRERDAGRRSEVRFLLEENSTLEPVDYYHAAWILNHGDQVADAELAFRMAERAYKAGHEPAKWLFAAAYDRWCMYLGRAQKYGTQIVPDGKRYRVWDVEGHTTDEEREEFNVPGLDQMHKRAREESAEFDQPPMHLAPQWLCDAIKRWEACERSDQPCK